MVDASIREELRIALSGMDSGSPLRGSGTSLLNVLGYRSGRTVDVGSVDDFLDFFGSDRGLTDKQRRLFEPWQTVEILFQLTNGEITGRQDLFEASEFDKGRSQSFLFVAAELAARPYTRTYLATTARTINRLFAMPVILLLRYGPVMTVAAIHRRPHRHNDNLDVLEKVTLVKDICLANPHRAHLEILADLSLRHMVAQGVDSFDALHTKWEETLDIEVLNKRFYRHLFQWFENATKQCSFPDDGGGEGSLERHVIRLITRLLFVWFLKEKGLVPEELFEENFARRALKNRGSTSTDYYRAILQNLFFATLNTKIEKRAFSGQSDTTCSDFSKFRYRRLLSDPDGFAERLNRVPFVNGGLFDCLDEATATGESGRRIDAFTDDEVEGRHLDVPAKLFFDLEDGLFPLLRRFKFTVEENTPFELEVALDPELLGRVFENLLAAYNPETRQTARQVTGSYYTPRQVVDYMVHEALTEGLAAKGRPADVDAKSWRERLHCLLDHSAAMDDATEMFGTDQRRTVIESIADLRTLDPAVGSGAFPMGVLQALTLALRRLDPDNVLWEEVQKQRAKDRLVEACDSGDYGDRERTIRRISEIFETYRQSDYGRKLYLIQNCIYGVDLQPIACQIAKLRFFISLVIEQNPDHCKPNLGIRPLPNLETRFVAADTLAGLQRADSSDLGKTVEVQELERSLSMTREHYFHAVTQERKAILRRNDNSIRSEMSQYLRQLGLPVYSADALAAWDPYNQNVSAGWFDPTWMFGVSDGFDVVIANPPYIESRNSLLATDRKEAYLDQVMIDHGDRLRKGSDILIYFFARAVKFLRSSGSCGCFITQNAWLATDYGHKFQKFCADRISFDRIVDTCAKFFSDASGPNINAVISFFRVGRGRTITFSTLNDSMNILEEREVTIQGSELKWGHLQSMPQYYIDLLMKLKAQESSPRGISWGQGLNVSLSVIDEVGSGQEAVPIHKSSACYAITAGDGVIPAGMARTVDKVPSLVMPRGIGERHFCALNMCGAFSYSNVEVYLSGRLKMTELHYCLWLYLNSSFVWLFREYTGRKNLGGGMLKSERTDMSKLPVHFSFDFVDAAKGLFDSMRSRTPLTVSEECQSADHLALDNVVEEYFGFSELGQTIRRSLVDAVSARVRRSRR